MYLLLQVMQFLLLKLKLGRKHLILEFLVSLLGYKTPVEDGYKTNDPNYQGHKDQNEEEILSHGGYIAGIEFFIDDQTSINQQYNKIG